MISYALWYLFITAGFVAAALAVWLMWFRFPDRTINDVADYLLPVDFEKAEGLLDPQTEAILRKELTPEEFRALQRKRMHHYLALVQRMAHNAAVLIEWANREARTATGLKLEMVMKLQQVGVEVRLYSLLALIKLRFWLLDTRGVMANPAGTQPGRYAPDRRSKRVRRLRPSQNRCHISFL